MNKQNRLLGEKKKIDAEVGEFGGEVKHFETCRWSVKIDDSDMFIWHAKLLGAIGTPYENQLYELELNFKKVDYPLVPPEVKFTKAIPFHANVYKNGTICIDILKTGDQAGAWSPALMIRTILLSLISMLNEPNTSSPANSDASRAYDNDHSAKKQEFSKLTAEHYAKQAHLMNNSF